MPENHETADAVNIFVDMLLNYIEVSENPQDDDAPDEAA